MKKFSLLILLLALSVFYSFVFNSENRSGDNGVILQFVTHNGYGNNLYIDNVTIGKQFPHDIKITSFINMPFDTSYAIGSTSLTIDSILALVTNVGSTTVDSAFFVLEIPEISYTDYDTVRFFSPNTMLTLQFDKNIVLPANRTYHAKLYLADSIDNNHSNDTLKQSFGYYGGVFKRVLFEEFTSATSSSAAINNPPLANFVNSKFDSIIAINYHVGFPAPGNDSMYLADTIAGQFKTNYYNIVSVPTLIFNGTYFSSYPFNTANLQKSFDTLKTLGSPMLISVTDTRLSGDTISSDISVNIVSPMKRGNYFLRVNAVERKVIYGSPPGNNGESVFYDVFRQALPNLQGIPIPAATGTYNYNVKYVRNPMWVDSMLYTAAFVQDDNTFEVVNSAKSRSGVFEKLKNFKIEDAPANFVSSDFKKDLHSKGSRVSTPKLSQTIFHDTTSTGFYLEQFENPGLPPDWTLAHLSELITFENVYNSGINGFTYPGNSCLRMNFYANPEIGQMDTLYSPVITGVTSLDTLRFEYAYSGYLYNEGDSLYINLSVDGGNTFTPIFAKGGLGLATTSSSTVSFVPIFNSQWRTFVLPLQGIVLDEFSIPIPKNFELRQNYPNPFNPSTKIVFTLPAEARTSLIVYDIAGREVKRLVDGMMGAGLHEINFSSESLASGIYFYTLVTPAFTQSKKMVFIK